MAQKVQKTASFLSSSQKEEYPEEMKRHHLQLSLGNQIFPLIFVSYDREFAVYHFNF